MECSGYIRRLKACFLLVALSVVLLPSAIFGAGTGTAVWRSGATTTPRYAEWDGSAFGVSGNTADIGTWRIIEGAESPTRDEIIVLGIDGAGDISGELWNGSTWTEFAFNDLASVSEPTWWGFAVAYEQQSGDAVIVWNNGSTGTNGISYRVWDGSSWTDESSITAPVSGEPQQMRIAASPDSDELLLIVSNSTAQDYALVWDGSAWGNSQILDSGGGYRFCENAAYEQQSGHGLVTYSKGGDRLYTRIWNGSAWGSEDSLSVPIDVGGDARFTDLASDPASDRIALGVLTASQDVWLNIWDGSSWGTPLTATNMATGTICPAVAVAFESQSGDGLAAYGEGSLVRYRTWTSGSGWSTEGTAANTGAFPNSLTLNGDPDSDHVMLAVQDNDTDLNYVLWDGSAWGTPSELETNSTQVQNQPFVFVWDIADIDLALGMGVNTGLANEGDTLTYTVTISNNSADTATNVQVTAELSSDLAYVWDSTTQGTYVSGTGVWSIGTILADSTASLVIRASVDPGTDGTWITNTANISSVDQTDINGANDSTGTSIYVKTGVFQVATGSYTGDGGPSQSISVVGFSPDVVIVKGDIDKPAYIKTTTMVGKKSKALGKGDVMSASHFNSLDANGFTVGAGDEVNALGVEYFWVAFQADDTYLALGSYPGDGTDDVSITGLGFQPGYVIIMSEKNDQAMQRFSSEAVGKSLEFKGSSEKDDRIQNFEPDGFQIGKDNSVNDGGATYHYVAWKATAGRIADGSYVGTENDYDSITTVGFQPEVVILKRNGGTSGVLRPASITGDSTFLIEKEPLFADGIQALIPNGFEIGTEDAVNKSGDTYYWAAFGGNLPPVLTAIGAKATNENANLTFGVSATDDESTPTLTTSTLPPGAGFTDDGDGTGDFDWTPTYLQSGSYDITFYATDDMAVVDSEVVTITVNEAGNQLPVLAAIGAKSTTENVNLAFGVSTSDIESTPVLTTSTLPPGAGFTDDGDGTGDFDWTPTYLQSGSYNVTFYATDDSAAVDSEVVTITVSEAGNQLPVLAAIGAKGTTEWHNLTFGVTATDIESTPVLTTSPLPTFASFTDNGDGSGTFSWTPWWYQSGFYNVTFYATDDSAAVDSEVVVITIGDEANFQPELTAIGAQATDENVNLAFAVTASDIESTPSLTTSSLPTGASFVDNGDGTGNFDWTPTYLQSGSYNITFYATDDSTAVDSEVVTITVSEAGNQPPVLAAIGAKATTENVNLAYGVSTTDAESTPALTTSTLPPGASFVDNGDGSGDFDWTPTYLQSGSYDITFYATDDSAAVDSEVVTITVNEAGNQPPVLAAIGARTTTEWDNLTFGVTTADIESTPSLTTSSLPTGAGFVDNGDGSGDFDWTPTYPQSGSYVVTFYATDDSAAVDSESVSITVNQALADHIEVSPDTVVAEIDSTVTYTVTGFTADSNPSYPGTITWSITAPLGNIDSTGPSTASFHATAVGTAQAIASSDLGLVDTTGLLQVIPGPLAVLTIAPDSVSVCADSTATFEVTGEDAFGNAVGTGELTWEVIGGVGSIDSAGLFTPQTAGSGHITATNTDLGVVDTNTAVVVYPGTPVSLAITPDTAVIGIDDSAQFTVVGVDAKGNPVAITDLSWKSWGRVGSIDSTGLFVPRAPGFGRVSVASTMFGLADTSDAIFVEALDVSGISIGTDHAYPSQTRALLLACRIENFFVEAKEISGLTARLAVRGPGSAEQRRGDIDSLTVYLDSDNDSLLTNADLRLAAAPIVADSVAFSFSPVSLAPDSGLTMLFGATVSDMPRDGDSLDLHLFPQLDIVRTDDTVVTGPDSLNSLGYVIIDGMTAAQVTIHAGDVTTVSASDPLGVVMGIDIPRNGYAADILESVALQNYGTAGPNDFDSLILWRDGGNLIFDGADQEQIVGSLVFTGGLWVLSGLSEALTAPTTRFYVSAVPRRYPTSGTTLALGIPRHGLTVASDNDGPIDQAVPPVDTATVIADEMVAVDAVTMPSGLIAADGSIHAVAGFVITNTASTNRWIDSMRVTSFAVDPRGATQTELDQQFEGVYLFEDIDGQAAVLGNNDTMIAVGTFSHGAVVLTFDNMIIPAAGGSRSLTLAVKLNPRYARNGNTINIGLDSPEHFFLAGGYAVDGDFPVRGRNLTVDRFLAEDVPVVPQAVTTHYGGQTDHVLFQFRLPANGYADDRLDRLTLNWSGTLESSDPIEAMRLWSDATGNGLTVDDELAGSFEQSGQVWRLDDLSWPVSGSGQNFLITVDLAASQFEGGTFQLSIPRGGVLYESGMAGPDDASVSMSESHLIVSSDRVTAVSIPVLAREVAPGSASHPLMTFALYNGYVGRAQTLQAVRLSNVSFGSGGTQRTDDELGQVALYLDTNGDRELGNDQLVAAGRFAGGQLRLDGLNISLPPESLSYFFVTADLPLKTTDGDSLAIEISETSDLTFVDHVSMNGNVPISSGNYLIVDGSVTDQYAVHSVPSRTLTPGDTSALLMAFQPTANGYRKDTLTALRLENHLSADSSDLVAVELWRDSNGDHRWQAGDAFVGSFAYVGGAWFLDGITLPIDTIAPTLLITGDVAAEASPDARVQLTLPQSGCTYASNNDGPRDDVLRSPGVFTVSTSGLRLTMNPPDETYSVGQDINVEVTAYNVSGLTIEDVRTEVVSISDPSIVLLQSSPPEPVAVPAGDSTLFTFTYEAVGSGITSWDVQAFSAATFDTSALLTTPEVTIQRMPSPVAVALLNSTPTAVTRGQANVFPLSLAITNTDTSLAAAPIQVNSLTFTVLGGSSVPQLAADVFSRVVLSTQYANLVVLESMPDGNDITLRLPDSVVILPGARRIFSLLVDIDSLASADLFALSLPSTDAVSASDINTGIRVPVTPTFGFPMTTASCRIENASTQVAVSNEYGGGGTVNEGQSGVPLLRLGVRHPGATGQSQIQLSELSLSFIGASGDTIPASSVVDRVQIRFQQLLIGEQAGALLESSPVAVVLNSPLTLSPGDAVSVDVLGTICHQASAMQFRVVVPDSSSFTARDLSSGSQIGVVTDTLALVTGSAFPIESGDFYLKQAAQPPVVCVEALAPASLVGGVDAAVLIGSTVSYDVDTSCSPLRLEEFRLRVIDTTGVGLNPGLLFDRIGYSIDNGSPVYQQFVEFESGHTVFRLGDDGIVMNPGDQVSVQLLVDLEVQPAYDNFAVLVDNLEALVIFDVTDPSYQLTAEWDDACSSSLPLMAGPTSVILPAGRPVLTPQERPVRLAYAGDRMVPLLSIEAQYISEVAQGEVQLDGLSARIVKRSGGGITPLEGNSPFFSISMYIDDVPMATDSVMAGDAVALQLPIGFGISSGFVGEISLTADISSDATVGNYAILIEDSTSFVMMDRELGGPVYPILRESSFPLVSADISVVAPSLGRSFTNYPNPFRPDAGQQTTIGYVLPGDARVSIELFTITGELVATLSDNAFRTAGAHQEDRWDGRNGISLNVVAGTYYCRITARYSSGREETFQRKVAVVR